MIIYKCDACGKEMDAKTPAITDTINAPLSGRAFAQLAITVTPRFDVNSTHICPNCVADAVMGYFARPQIVASSNHKPEEPTCDCDTCQQVWRSK